MKLDRQLQVLIDEATQYGIAPIVMELAIAPVLQAFAQQLEHSEYYVLQNLQEDWVVSTISNRPRQTDIGEQPSKIGQKRVIYAFTSVKDAKNFNRGGELEAIAIALPIVQILFRVFSLQQIDSIIFFPRSGNLDRGIEVPRQDLQNAIEQQLLQLKNIKNAPPNLA